MVNAFLLVGGAAGHRPGLCARERGQQQAGADQQQQCLQGKDYLFRLLAAAVVFDLFNVLKNQK